jgi:DNA-binding MarR family transcriptional regulator
MEARGLSTRASDPDDARGSIYHLTDVGRAALRDATPTHLTSVRDRFLDHLTRDELATLAQISRRIADLDD